MADGFYQYKKAFVLGMHSFCPVIPTMTVDNVITFNLKEHEVASSTDYEFGTDSNSDNLQIVNLEVAYVSSTDYGTVRLYSLASMETSQLDMLVDTFDNSIDVDLEYVPPEVAE